MLQATLHHLLGSPPGRVQFPPRGGVSFNPALYAAVEVIQKDGVGAGPAAPDAPEQRGHVEQPEGQT